jgi:hypothetical protein
MVTGPLNFELHAPNFQNRHKVPIRYSIPSLSNGTAVFLTYELRIRDFRLEKLAQQTCHLLQKGVRPFLISINTWGI